LRLLNAAKNPAAFRLILSLAGLAVLAACGGASSSSISNSGANPAEKTRSGYHLANKFTLGGDPGWDYVAIDPDARRVYVTHYMRIEVLDADTGKSVGQIIDTPGVHGIALVKGKGFTSNGKADTVSVIDLKTNKALGEKEGAAPSLTFSGSKKVEFFKIKTEDGVEMDGWMVKPKTFDPAKKYPVVFFVYTEPASQTVRDAFSIGRNRLLAFERIMPPTTHEQAS